MWLPELEISHPAHPCLPLEPPMDVLSPTRDSNNRDASTVAKHLTRRPHVVTSLPFVVIRVMDSDTRRNSVPTLIKDLAMVMWPEITML